jgi:hypothetical protein
MSSNSEGKDMFSDIELSVLCKEVKKVRKQRSSSSTQCYGGAIGPKKSRKSR